MKIATYNVNGVNGRLPVLIQWLNETKPDVVCLQELKAPQEKFPEQAIKEAGYNAIWHGQKSWNGVAILARNLEITERRRGLPNNTEDDQSRYIEALINGVIIACLYLPNVNPHKPFMHFLITSAMHMAVMQVCASTIFYLVRKLTNAFPPLA